MTDEEKDAMEWLDRRINDPTVDPHMPIVLKRLLQRPVLPEKLTKDMIYEMVRAWYKLSSSSTGEECVAAIHKALYRHLHATKEVEVEMWCVVSAHGLVQACFDERDAEREAMIRTEEVPLSAPYSIVRLTGKAMVRA
jgi:hypothetical protein